MDKVQTGIYGLDELLGGGFLPKRNILVSGACGTGKTIFSIQYLMRGALEYGEPGVYVAFDERPELIRQDMLTFGWDMKDLERKGLLSVLDVSVSRIGYASEEEHALVPGQMDFDSILNEAMRICRESGAKRFVIDSIPALAMHVKDTSEIRRLVFKLGVMFSKAGLTSIMTSEVPEQSLSAGQAMSFSKFGVEEYIADGVILLNYMGIGTQTTRTLYIRKMRGTKHSDDIHPLEITDKGIVVKKVEEAYKV
jgi:KaiC/GvpD/RAD55 family RecA-like ATPase